MIIISGFHEHYITEERLDDSDEQYVEALVQEMYQAGAQVVEVDKVGYDTDYTFPVGMLG